MLRGLIGSSVVGVAVLVSCLPQRPPPCQVVATDDQHGPYLAKLTRTSATDCAEGQLLASMLIGVQSFAPPGAAGPTLALRPSRLLELRDGPGFTADLDAGNNCLAAKEGRSSPRCATCAPDSGNPCLVVEEAVPRTDSTDPTGARLDAVGAFTAEPTEGICAAAGPLTGSQAFDAVTVRLADGGTLAFPAFEASFAFTDVRVLSSARARGAAFTAKLAQREGSCRAQYDVAAFFPAIRCATDEDCRPLADVDAGRLTGSGIDGVFSPVCEVTLGFCVPTVDLKNPELPAR